MAPLKKVLVAKERLYKAISVNYSSFDGALLEPRKIEVDLELF